MLRVLWLILRSNLPINEGLPRRSIQNGPCLRKEHSSSYNRIRVLRVDLLLVQLFFVAFGKCLLVVL